MTLAINLKGMPNFNDLPELRKWCILNKFFTRTKDYTHLLLDNGKLKIPKNKTEMFLEKYADDIASNAKHYICEIKTPIFRLFSDLDFFEVEELSDEDLRCYIKAIQKVVGDFFQSDQDKHVIVCTTDSKQVTVDKQNYIKTGVHLIWPNLYVSKPTALLLRQCIIQFLHQKFNSRPSYNSWSDVVDLSVFDQNGLRMIGSRKMSNCDICKNSKRKMCDNPKCLPLYNKARKVDEGRAYKPTLVIDSQGENQTDELKKLQGNWLRTVLQTTIRVEQEIDETPHSPPIWFQFTEETQKKRRTKKKKVVPGKEDLVGIQELRVKQRIADTDLRFTKLKTFAKRQLPDCYKKTNITDLFLCLDGFYVAQTDSRFCMNVGREHNSNHIYFCINKNFIYQKCFCRCESTEGRSFGICKNYRSDGRKLSNSLRCLLFPELQSKTFKAQDYEQFMHPVTEDEQLDDILNGLESNIFNKRTYEDTTFNSD